MGSFSSYSDIIKPALSLLGVCSPGPNSSDTMQTQNGKTDSLGRSASVEIIKLLYKKKSYADVDDINVKLLLPAKFHY